MPIYKYKFIKDGEEREETKEFADKAALYSSIRSQNGSIISVEETKGGGTSFKFFSFRNHLEVSEHQVFLAD